MKVVISIYSKKLRSSAGEPISKTEEWRKEIGRWGGERRELDDQTSLPVPVYFVL